MKKLYTLLLFAITVFSSTAQIVNIPDAAFKEKLLSANAIYPFATDFNDNNVAVDTNHDGQIQVSEALVIKKLDVNGSYGPNVLHASSLTGIEAFANLESLQCQFNLLTTLNVNSLVHLTELNCSFNQLNGLNISALTNLEKLNYSYNPLANPSLTNLMNLKTVTCSGNQLSLLPDFSNSINLEQLDCSDNNLSSLNLTQFSHLRELNCGINLLTSLTINGLDLRGIECGDNPQLPTMNFNSFPNLVNLGCYNNPLQGTLDLSNCPNLNYVSCNNSNLTSLLFNDAAQIMYLNCNDNNLTTLFIHGTIYSFSLEVIGGFYFANNPGLHYICVDDSMVDFIQNRINQFGYNATCHVNSYCNFTPAGADYTIQGTTKYDENTNGCDTSDINYPSLKVSITDTTTTGTTIANYSGTYDIPVPAGIHTFTPVLENPNYFYISPTSASVNFPTTASPFIQDFCITPNGTHKDLEVVVVPIQQARPGFDVQYKVIYKNKGNQTQSGAVNLTFDDSRMDLIFVSPNVTSSVANTLSWNFSDLHPFESRTILVIMNLNSPTETPPVINGDILNFTATITNDVDETPSDNTSTFNQTVLGSYDPNDKTCLEGTTISPAMVGNYVHYIIRFENTGTFAAENIVVADVIDSNKFDISTLIPESSSHNFRTRINGNKVEFIFENINLPFDDANNDGYVAFKIKTKPSLVVGDTFSNSANIYFDYNFPILTNTATTTIQTLGNQDFEFGNYFSVYPNPTKQVLNLETKAEIGVNSINIYNILGQIVIAIPNAESVSSIEVSNLKTGTYFIKVTTDKGSANAKFIKN